MTKRLAMMVLLALSMATALAEDAMVITEDAALGKWTSNFAAATNLSFTTKKPMIMFWGNDRCPHCGNLEAAFATDTFCDWQQRNGGFVYCCIVGQNGKDVGINKDSGAKSFAASAAGSLDNKESLTGYPFVCFWWPKEDGSVAVKSFVGRPGTMLVPRMPGLDESLLEKHDPTMLSLLSKEFTSSAEKFFVGYNANVEPEFAVGATAGNRLEAEPTTAIVPVPLRRAGGGEDMSTLRVNWPNSMATAVAYPVVWKAGQTTATVMVSMTPIAGDGFPDGQKITLTLSDSDGKQLGESSISCVQAKPNIVTNPFWIGERTADTLAWSEWTLDYDIVREKVSKVRASGSKAYVMAVFSGTMWCPYCKGIEESLFASAEFKTWLEKNNVQPILFDQGLSSSDAYPGAAHLLSYEAGEEHINPAGNRALVSGADYLSRHGIDGFGDKAQSVHARCMDYSFDKWLAPGTASVRLGNPTILLIGDDKVIGRFSAWRDSSNSLGKGSKYYEPMENIARLDDLIKLGSRTDESSDYSQTTLRVLRPGMTATADFQINDRDECFLLEGLSSGVATFTANAARDITLSLVVDGKIVATGVNELEAIVTRSYLKASRICLKTSGTMPDKLGAQSSVYRAIIGVSLEERATGDIYVGFSQTTELEKLLCEEGARVTVRKASGKLPAGVKLYYDNELGAVILQGTARKPGTYTFSYQITVKGTAGTETFQSDEIELTVIDSSEINPHLSTNAKYAIPLTESVNNGAKSLCGIVTVTTRRTGQLSAKFEPSSGSPVNFSGRWSQLDATDGLSTTTLVKSGLSLTLSLSASGIFSAKVGDLEGEVAAGDFAAYDGRYTLTLPLKTQEYETAIRGTGYATLTARKGTVAAKLVLPDGTRLSCKANMALDPSDREFALLPLFKSSSKGGIAALLRVRAEGNKLYQESETAAVVLSPEGILARWQLPKSKGFVDLEVYGGYYDNKLGESGYLDLFGLDKPQLMIEGMPIDAKYRVTKTTGLFSGSAKVSLTDGTAVSGKFSGVLLPGWIDCHCGDGVIERPFASGQFIYSAGGIKYSVPVELVSDKQ